MHPAPPVSVRGTGGRGWRAVQVLLPALAAGVFSAWLMAHAQASLFPAVLPALAVGAWALRSTQPRSRTLAWDGQQWLCDDVAGELQVMIDLDRWVLLRWRVAGARWLWTAQSAAESGPVWPLLWAALHARRPAPALPAPHV